MAHEVDLPGGGHLELNDAGEVELWEASAERYVSDYNLTKQNDLVLLGAILSQNLAMYRAQRELNDADKATGAQQRIVKASGEIRELEKALGIDRKSREAGGKDTVADYVGRLKLAAHAKGVHIAARVKAYEAFMMELRWKLRLLKNGDDEDRAHHGLSDRAIIAWAEAELGKLEELDKKWAQEKGAVFVGTL